MKFGKLSLLVAFVLSILFPAMSSAQSIEYTSRIPVGSATNQDVTFQSEPTVVSTEQATALAALQQEITTKPQAAGDDKWNPVFGMPGVKQDISTMVSSNNKLFAVISEWESSLAVWNGSYWQYIDGVIDGKVEDIATDGTKVYIVGDFTKVGTVAAPGAAVWDGSKWARLGTGKGPEIVDQWSSVNPGDLNAVAVQGNTVYVGGRFTQIGGVKANSIVSWNGTAWSALGEGLRDKNDFEPEYEQGVVHTIKVIDGTLYVGGQFDVAGTVETYSLARWSNNTWSGIGGGVTDDDQTLSPAGGVYTIAGTANNLYIGGNFDHAGTVDAKNIARWNGTAWNALGDGAYAQFENEFSPVVESVSVVNNVVYAAGSFEFVGDEVATGFASWNGTKWTGYSIVDDYEEIVAVQPAPNNGVYIGGRFNQINNTLLVNNVALWTGTAWNTLGKGFSLQSDFGAQAGTVRAVVVDAQGLVYAGGTFKSAGGTPVNNLAVWDGTKWSALGSGTTGGASLEDGSVEALLLVGNDLYIGGRFTTAGGISANHFAKYNIGTKQWSQVGGGVDGPVYSLARAENGAIFVGGDFDTVGTTTARDIAAWNGTKWSALGTGIEIYEVFDSCNERSTSVRSIATSGNQLFVGGVFTLVYKGTGNRCSEQSYLVANHVLNYDISEGEWYLLGQGSTGVTGGNKVFANPVSALAVRGNTVYVGGHFSRAGNVNANNIAAFDLTSGWSALGTGVTGSQVDSALSTGPEVLALYREADTLYVGGDFTTTGNGAAFNIAKFNLTTKTWSPIGSGMSNWNYATKVETFSRTNTGMYIGGDFLTAGGFTSSSIAFYNLGAIVKDPNDPVDPEDPKGSYRVFFNMVMGKD